MTTDHFNVAKTNTKSNSKMTTFLKLLDMWNDNKYIELGCIIEDESWKPARVAEFCNYMAKNAGTQSLEQLYKFL